MDKKIAIGGKKPEPAALTADASEIKNISRRLRVLEERMTNMQSRIQLLEENSISTNKKNNLEFKSIESDSHDIKKDVLDIKEKLEIVISDLGECAKDEELQVLKKYVDFWEPVKFITRNELKEILRLFSKEYHLKKPKKKHKS